MYTLKKISLIPTEKQKQANDSQLYSESVLRDKNLYRTCFLKIKLFFYTIGESKIFVHFLKTCSSVYRKGILLM